VISNQPLARRSTVVLLLLVAACSDGSLNAPLGDKPIVIAHRGASGYLPEHTIAAKAMAYAQGADYIEQDLVMTRDNEVVVLHDHHLDTVSNVADLYPDRARQDGRYYVVDFTLDEIRRLTVSERFSTHNGQFSAVFPDRFPLHKSTFRINTLAEEIELIQGLNRSAGRSVGIYPEIKSPGFHRDEGKDISSAVLDILRAYGYASATDRVYLQCFDPYELIRIRKELLPARKMDIRLVQLIGYAEEFAPLVTPDGILQIAEYAAGIGPSMHLLVDPDSDASDLQVTELVGLAHAAGLTVHPYTFRREASQIPEYAKDFEDLLGIFLNRVGVDGIFTDFPDRTVRFIETMQ
jgi:glycerophosphoryl diester phosphodiesterase